MRDKPLGRPRKIHSVPSSGSGAHEFTADEREKIRVIADDYGFDADEGDITGLLKAVWLAYTRFLAIAEAMKNRSKATPKHESAEIQSIIRDATFVRRLLAEMADLTDAQACIARSARFAERLENFPNRMAGEITKRGDAIEFMYSLMRLSQTIISIRHWPERRHSLISDIDNVVDVCGSLPSLPRETKRENTARHIFERELGEIYCDKVHPARRAIWDDASKDSTNPPPPSSHRAFARKVMNVLNVEFESKAS